MQDKRTKKQLLEELSALHQQIDNLKKFMTLFGPEGDVFEVIGNSIQVGIYIIQDGKTIFANTHMSLYSGYSREELLNLALMQDTVHPEDQARVRECGIRMLRSEDLAPYEYRILCKDGSIKWLMEKVTSIKYRGQRAVLGNTMDVTDKKRTEDELREIKAKLEIRIQERTSALLATNEALKESEERYRILSENASDIIWTLDLNLRFTYASPSVEKQQGWTVEELKSLCLQDIMPPDSLATVMEVFEEELALEKMSDIDPKRSRTLELEEYRKDGSTIWIEVTASFLRDKEGNAIGIIGISRDITDRKKSDDALRQSENWYRTIFENTGTATVILEEDTTITLANTEFEKLSGFTRNEIEEKMSWTVFVVKEDLDLMVEKHRQRRIDRKATPTHYEFRFRDKSANVRHIFLKVDMIPGTNRSVASLLDITERNRAEEALRESEERYRNVFENHSAVKFLIDPDTGSIIEANEAAVNYYGWSHERLKQMKIQEINVLPSEDVKKEMEKARTKKRINFEFRHRRADGSIRDVEVFSSKIEVKGKDLLHSIIHDITERKRVEEEKRSLEERLQRAEKMEALGTLAGGVAHDLNNVLGIVIGYSELLLSKIGESSPIMSYIMNIMQGGERAAAIVQDLLTLARRGVHAGKVVNLNTTIIDFQKTPEFMNLSSFHPKVHTQTNLDPDLLNINGSPVHLSKTLTNLVSNAAEAMPNGGELVITTSNQYLDRPVQGYDDVEEGDYVVLSVSDTGDGIPAADLKRIFEPFYTKKVMGRRRGTGLGLAVVWGTVKDHDGYINVQSEEGKGSTFTIYFPVTREDISEDQISVPVSEYIGNGESILVVDDIKSQRELTTQMLGKLNYNVATVSSGEEAVEYVKQTKVDLIVLDMIMDPGIDGLDTYKMVLEINPKQKAIIVSGFSETDRVNQAQGLGAGAYIRKPYLLEKLGLAVRKELDRST